MEKRPIYVKLPRKLKKAMSTDFVPKRYYRCITLVAAYAKYPTPKALKYMHAYIMARDSKKYNYTPDELYRKFSGYSYEMLEDYYEIFSKINVTTAGENNGN